MSAQKRFFLGTDDSGHWYIVPVEQQDAWWKWRDLDTDDEASWTAPEWAEEVGGSYTLVTFTDPRVA